MVGCVTIPVQVSTILDHPSDKKNYKWFLNQWIINHQISSSPQWQPSLRKNMSCTESASTNHCFPTLVGQVADVNAVGEHQLRTMVNRLKMKGYFQREQKVHQSRLRWTVPTNRSNSCSSTPPLAAQWAHLEAVLKTWIFWIITDLCRSFIWFESFSFTQLDLFPELMAVPSFPRMSKFDPPEVHPNLRVNTITSKYFNIRVLTVKLDCQNFTSKLHILVSCPDRSYF